MTSPLFSSSWYRVAQLRPRLRSHARIHRHLYRGKPWYLIQDLTNHKFHRFPPAAHTLIGLMDGERTVEEIWLHSTETLGDAAPTQDDMIRLLAQLHLGDLIQSDVPPDIVEQLERHEQRTRRERFGRFMNPFAIRIPVVDPERFLTRTLPYVRPLFGWAGLALWLAVVLPAVVLGVVHYTELTEGFFDRAFTPQNLLLIWLIFPVLKALHELGHGYMAKRFGGEIHDMGIMFLVFTPIPYVDASSVSAFRSNRKRALVGAAGMIVEVFVAALAFYVWLNAEPGVVRAVAFNTILIGAVTTLGFNANPLLRFDGYYILADLIEMPNLRQRSSRFLSFLFERYALGRRRAERAEASSSEEAWFVGYGVSSFLYRVLVVVAIFLFVLEKSLLVGGALVLLSSIGWIVMPTVRAVRALFSESHPEDSRPRVWAVLVGGAALLVLLLGVIPVPHRTQTEGVVWIPENALVRAGTNGFVSRVVANVGQPVRAGDRLIECVDADLAAQVRVLEARLRVLDARYQEEVVVDQVRGAMVLEERGHVAEQLAHAHRRRDDLVIRAGIDGVFAAYHTEDMPGRWVDKGQAIAHVLPKGGATIRAVVSQDDIDLVREGATRAEVRFAESLGSVYPARILRIVPGASAELPSTALGSSGGGQVAIDPRDSRGRSALKKQFVVELDLPAGYAAQRLGERVHVRFAHPWRPLAAQWYRGVRQLFLSRLHV